MGALQWIFNSFTLFKTFHFKTNQRPRRREESLFAYSLPQAQRSLCLSIHELILCFSTEARSDGYWKKCPAGASPSEAALQAARPPPAVLCTESDQHSVPRKELSVAPVKEPYAHQSLCCGPKCSCFQRTEPITSAGITHRPYNWEASKRLLRPRQGWETSGGACARPFQGFKTCKAFAVHWQQKGTGGL